ncbi:MAG TPA: 4-alpha-glucanotransferase [Polyangiaceae bacterium]|nr:4-alpha-glucanotransferase [Polyangiaceae bacterium]
MDASSTRSAGILLHPTSLPGPHGIGSLGSYARGFIDFLAAAGQSYWQILPLGPTGYGNSPYSALSTFAGNPWLIDLQTLVTEGLLHGSELAAAPLCTDRVDYGAVGPFKTEKLHLAAERFATVASAERREKFEAFEQQNAWWLDNYALFEAVKQANEGKSIRDWDTELRCREPAAIARASQQLATEIRHQRVMQFLFFEQWAALRSYAHGRGVRIIGDMPIFVSFDSDVVWAHPELFKVDANLTPSVVAGVPPDHFSATGQLWDNPLYDWKTHEKQGFNWWVDRVRMALLLADVVRLDHFRGFEAAWEVPSHHADACHGTWVKGPGNAFFDALRSELGSLPFIAEDLGLITKEVYALRDHYGLPGMRVLQFGFGTGEDRYNAPHRVERNSVVYTGTHDNDTTVGWFRTLSAKDRAFVQSYLNTSGATIHWAMIRAAYGTVADTVIIPIQDVLGLGSEARMNMPGQMGGWWAYRLTEQPHAAVAEKLRELTELYERCPS